MLKLTTLGIVFGVLMLTGCSEPPTGPGGDYGQVGVEQPREIASRNQQPQRDSILVAVAEDDRR
jgi:hypothetical protein